MSDAPILIFDSGVGGLSVAKPVMQTLPHAPIVYAADNAGFPYGSKTEAEITARVPAMLGRLVERYRPRLAIIACNTASTIALAHVRAALDLPVVGTVPAIKPAAALTRSGVIGLLGTPATVRQHYVDDLEAKFARDCTVLRHGAPDLAAHAEAVLRGEDVPDAAFAAAMAGLLEQEGGDRMDVVALACTHFPLVADRLAKAGRREIAFVDGGEGIARRTAHWLADAEWSPEPQHRAVFTKADGSLDALRAGLAGYGFTSLETL
ncbi:MAG: glutamate racemase [Pacificimonas sp.]